MKTLTVIIPCYNEEQGVAHVISSVPHESLRSLGYEADILVIDNNSTDRTASIALEKGARVIHEPKKGKGNAILAGFRNVHPEAAIVVMIDGDNSYKANEMTRLIEPLDSGFSDVILGTRLGGRMASDSMTAFNRAGNWLFTFLVRVVYSGNVTDVCTGYFAWRREVVDELQKHIKSNGFSVEMELVTKMAKLGYLMHSFPITYDERHGESSLRPIKDGSIILYTWLRNMFWRPETVKKNEPYNPLQSSR